jgi:hypothetical protein
MTTEERYAVLSALVDRESVDPDAVATALDGEEGRRVLVDIVRLRRLVASEIESELPVTVAPVAPRRGTSLWRLAAAALLPLVLGLGGGYWWRVRAESQPPTPTRVVQFVPGVDWK